MCKKNNFKDVAEMLRNQKSLDTLILECHPLPVDRKLSLHPDFKVRRLFIKGVQDPDPSRPRVPKNVWRTDSELIDVTMPFQDRVECLSFEGSTEKENFEKIVNGFTNISALRIDTMLPNDEDFYIKANTNANLKELVLCHEVTLTALIGIFQIFPNIKNLTITTHKLQFGDRKASTYALEDLEESLGQLERFVVQIVQPTMLSTVGKVLRNISALYISRFNNSCEWEALRPACVNSQFLSIENACEKLNIEAVVDIFPNLRTLNLPSEIFKEEHLEKMGEKLKNLNFLQLTDAPRDFKMLLDKEAKSLGMEQLVIIANPKTDFSGSEYSLKGIFEHDYVYVKNPLDALYDFFV